MSPTRSQTWTLDPLGNWGSTVLDSVTESRVHNDVNELTSRTVGQNPGLSVRSSAPGRTWRRADQWVRCLTYDDAGNPACERREQTGREPARRVPKGCDAEGAHNLTQRRTDRPRRLLWRSGCARAATATRSWACGPRPVWDYRNRLKQVKERQSGSWVTVADYKFDALNRRVRRSVSNKGSLNPACEQSEQTGREPAGRVPQGCNAEGGHNGVTWSACGGGLSAGASRQPGDAGMGLGAPRPDWQCLEERGGADGLVARYTYAPGYTDAVAVQERDLNADQDFLDTNEVVYYHSNTLFSVYALSDSAGSAVERYRYDPYGQATVLDADGSDDADNVSDVGNPYLFTGRSLAAESGLMYYRNRQYSPTLGRFLTRDPTVPADHTALYPYASGRPSGVVDPLGLFTWVCTNCDSTQHVTIAQRARGACQCLTAVAAMSPTDIACRWQKSARCRKLLGSLGEVPPRIMGYIRTTAPVSCGTISFKCDQERCYYEGDEIPAYSYDPPHMPIHLCTQFFESVGEQPETLIHEYYHIGTQITADQNEKLVDLLAFCTEKLCK